MSIDELEQRRARNAELEAARVRAIVDAAPPLTEQQRARVAVLLRRSGSPAGGPRAA